MENKNLKTVGLVVLFLILVGGGFFIWYQATGEPKSLTDKIENKLLDYQKIVAKCQNTKTDKETAECDEKLSEISAELVKFDRQLEELSESERTTASSTASTTATSTTSTTATSGSPTRI